MSVAKLATDAKGRLRHNRRDMPKYPINVEQFRAWRKVADYRSDAAFWKAVTDCASDLQTDEDTSDRSRLSKILTGKRNATSWELGTMARLLRVSKDELSIVLGIEPKEGIQRRITVSGLLKEGGDVMFATNDAPPMLEESYSEAAYAHRGKLLKVADNSMGPRYMFGDLVEYGDPHTNYDNFLKLPVVVKFSDGTVRLRIIHASDRVGFYTFNAINYDGGQAPITTDRIEWVAPIEAIFPPKR